MTLMRVEARPGDRIMLTGVHDKNATELKFALSTRQKEGVPLLKSGMKVTFLGLVYRRGMKNEVVLIKGAADAVISIEDERIVFKFKKCVPPRIELGLLVANQEFRVLSVDQVTEGDATRYDSVLDVPNGTHCVSKRCCATKRPERLGLVRDGVWGCSERCHDGRSVKPKGTLGRDPDLSAITT